MFVIFSACLRITEAKIKIIPAPQFTGIYFDLLQGPFNELFARCCPVEICLRNFRFSYINQIALQHHVASIATIFEMLEVAGRADLKSDLLQNLIVRK